MAEVTIEGVLLACVGSAVKQQGSVLLFKHFDDSAAVVSPDLLSYELQPGRCIIIMCAWLSPHCVSFR